jgi:hypothetical protein
MMLREGLQPNGSIDPNMRPKDLWESNVEYQKFSLPSFRAAFNREKSLHGLNARTDGKF